MTNNLGQPTEQEIAEKFCTEMLCDALLCEGCPVYAIKPSALKSVQADTADWSCKSCGFENHSAWRKCGNCETLRQ